MSISTTTWIVCPGLLLAMMAAGVLAAEPSAPWLTNEPIVTVQKELYLEHSQPGVAVSVQHFRLGNGLDRMEVVHIQAESDIGTNFNVRFSGDNGRTWSDPQSLPDNVVTYNGVKIWEGHDNSMPIYDPVAQVLIQPWLRQNMTGGSGTNHAYYRISTDLGRTWSTPKQLKYESGPDFDPANPNSAAWLTTNNSFLGMKFATTSDGKVVMGVGDVNNPNDPLNSTRDGRQGALNFIGAWNAAKQDYDWQAGNRVFLSSNISSRGLMETETAELSDGRILNVWRGSNRRIDADGRKWFSVSTDGGMNLSPVQELKYDDGSRFYSPSSMNRLFRSELTGKLYLIGNITPTNSNGNAPRHPLVIAEIDEQLVALKKDTVTVIANLEPGQLPTVQFSNFSLLENPETHQIELFMSDWGARSNVFDADAYKYTLTFVSAPEPVAGAMMTYGGLALFLRRALARRRGQRPEDRCLYHRESYYSDFIGSTDVENIDGASLRAIERPA